MMKIHLCRCRFCNCLGHSVVVSITVLYSPLPPRYLRCRPRQRHQLPPHPLSSLSLTCTRASARLQSQSDLAHKASCVLLRPRDREVFDAASTDPPTRSLRSCAASDCCCASTLSSVVGATAAGRCVLLVSIRNPMDCVSHEQCVQFTLLCIGMHFF